MPFDKIGDLISDLISGLISGFISDSVSNLVLDFVSVLISDLFSFVCFVADGRLFLLSVPLFLESLTVAFGGVGAAAFFLDAFFAPDAALFALEETAFSFFVCLLSVVGFSSSFAMFGISLTFTPLFFQKLSRHS